MVYCFYCTGHGSDGGSVPCDGRKLDETLSIRKLGVLVRSYWTTYFSAAFSSIGKVQSGSFSFRFVAKFFFRYDCEKKGGRVYRFLTIHCPHLCRVINGSKTPLC